MVEELHYCNNCGREQWQPKGCKEWCNCKPRVKNEMRKYKPELQKIMRLERKINMEYVQ